MRLNSTVRGIGVKPLVVTAFLIIVYRQLRRGSVRENTGLLAIGLFSLVLVPAWYFFGYLISGPYFDYKRLCKTDAKFAVVQERPSDTVYSELCSTVRKLLFVDSDNTILAFSRHYRLRPYGDGTFARQIGDDSVRAPSMGCGERLPYNFLQLIFPPQRLKP